MSSKKINPPRNTRPPPVTTTARHGYWLPAINVPAAAPMECPGT